MDWSPEQSRALDAVGRWFRDPEPPVFKLFGYAGTGKTTLARHIADTIGGQVMFAAFTGKAAHVLTTKGCPASTIHSLIYKSFEPNETRLNQLKEMLFAASNPSQKAELEHQVKREEENLKRPHFALNSDSVLRQADLLIIDECSMVDKKMGQDLVDFGVPILVLGDPGQLPPVAGAGFFMGQPDFLLEEIHRQAADSPIIHMATKVRQGQRLPIGKYGDCHVISAGRVGPKLHARADQILVGRNMTRHALNQKIHLALGHEEWWPETGEKIVCLRNDHEMGWLNGEMFNLHCGPTETPERDQVFFFEPVEKKGCVVHPEPFQGQAIDLPWWERKSAQEFDFGHAITVHKSQGSQWDRVLLMNEAAVFRENARKWLYTGITRAAKRLVVAQ